jgi:diaminohydroxyphosphoribosylaminopyrimidine deaminase/5-amino-6-(5-phosphoribosylamino)uracil reductase
MTSRFDRAMLLRALRLAMTARGRVEPNPMVACVITRNESIIGEGFHGEFGGPHAEPTALLDCTTRGNDPRGATAYVTLEPCCHLDKKTPPCAPRLIEAGIARVVIGCLDPNPKVDGRGVAMLRQAGIEVDLLESSAGDPMQPDERAMADREPVREWFEQLLAPFTLLTRTGRPYITLKWAESADGAVAGPGGSRRQISGAEASRFVHRLRSQSDAIMVGVNTVIADNPLLTARPEMFESEGRRLGYVRPCLRIVLDRRGRMPADCQLRCTDRGDVRVLNHATLSEAIASLNAGAGRAIAHVLVEPGPTLAEAFFRENLADRLVVIRSDRPLNEPGELVRAAAIPRAFVMSARRRLVDDEVIEYLSRASGANKANIPGVEFQSGDEID